MHIDINTVIVSCRDTVFQENRICTGLVMNPLCDILVCLNQSWRHKQSTLLT